MLCARPEIPFERRLQLSQGPHGSIFGTVVNISPVDGSITGSVPHKDKRSPSMMVIKSAIKFGFLEFERALVVLFRNLQYICVHDQLSFQSLLRTSF